MGNKRHSVQPVPTGTQSMNSSGSPFNRNNQASLPYIDKNSFLIQPGQSNNDTFGLYTIQEN